MSEEINGSRPTEDRPAVETETSAAAAQGAPTTAAANEEDGAGTERKRLGGWQRKIQKLERENEQLREIALNSSRGKSEPEAAKHDDDAEPVEPKPEDFKTWEEYEKANKKFVRDLVAYSTGKAVAKSRTETQQETEAQRVQKGWEGQLDTARKSHADFDEVAFDDDLPITPTMAEFVITSEHGAEIAYLLGQDPKEAKRISELSKLRQVAELGKLETRFARETNSAPEKEEKPEKKPAPTPESKAPAPPQPVRRASSTDDGSLRDDLDPKEWQKRFNKKMEAARS